jgi:hypothetical protein
MNESSTPFGVVGGFFPLPPGLSRVANYCVSPLALKIQPLSGLGTLIHRGKIEIPPV